MDAKLLVKQFRADAGESFVEVIRTASEKLRAQQIKQPFIAAGLNKDDVDRAWKRVQRNLHRHPHIHADNREYEWISKSLNAADALQRLASEARTGPGWLRQEYVNTINDSLAYAETSGPNAGLSWTQQKQREKARAVAELTAGAEVVAAEGGNGIDVATWLVNEVWRQRVEVIARLGERQTFDPEVYEVVDGHRPAAGTEVDVVRSGFRYVGGDDPEVVVRPQVRARN